MPRQTLPRHTTLVALALLTHLACHAAPLNESVGIWADRADYQAHELSLDGHVAIELASAFITANHAQLHRESDAAAHLRQLQLEGQVRIRLDGGGTLTSASARLDLSSGTGEFSGSLPLQQVHLHDDRIDLTCHHLAIAFKEGSISELTSLRAEGEVRLQTPDHHCALADRAHYNPETDEISLSPLAGKQVLVMGESGEKRLAADALVIDRTTMKIRGVGKVRFNLTDEEAASLKEAFESP